MIFEFMFLQYYLFVRIISHIDGFIYLRNSRKGLAGDILYYMPDIFIYIDWDFLIFISLYYNDGRNNFRWIRTFINLFLLLKTSIL